MPNTMTQPNSTSRPMSIHSKAKPAADKRRRDVECQAVEALQAHPLFKGRCDLIKVRCRGNQLQLGGTVPSFYLKQMAQELVRPLGSFLIDNRIVVFGMPDTPTRQTRIRRSLVPNSRRLPR